MGIFGRLIENRRAGDADSAWNRPNLQGPDVLRVSSEEFNDGERLPLECVSTRVGGKNRSPSLLWDHLPPDTSDLILVVEDLDVPVGKPFIHCLAIVVPTRLTSPDRMAMGALSEGDPAAGVRLMRSTIGRGYQGPYPPKGHGVHHYTFQLFACSQPFIDSFNGNEPDRLKPRDVLAQITSPVIGRGRLTGTYQR